MSLLDRARLADDKISMLPKKSWRRWWLALYWLTLLAPFVLWRKLT